MESLKRERRREIEEDIRAIVRVYKLAALLHLDFVCPFCMKVVRPEYHYEKGLCKALQGKK